MRKLYLFKLLIAGAFLLMSTMAVNAQSDISVDAIGEMGPDHRLELRFSDMHAHLVYDLNQLKLKDDQHMFESFIVNQDENIVEVILRYEDMGTPEVLAYFQSHLEEWASHWHSDILNEPEPTSDEILTPVAPSSSQ